MTNASLDLRVTRPLRAVSPEEIEACKTFHGAISATVNGSGLQDKSVAIEADIDPAQLSKMMSGQAGIQADKLFRLMDTCGSELPLLWLLWQRGYDPASLRERETELERRIRSLEAEVQERDKKLQHFQEFLGIRSAA